MYGRWGPYVRVSTRRAKASRFAAQLAKQGQALRPVTLSGRTITKTFWGKAWCENLESYSDFDNRLPRGRTYVRNGSVIDLQISTHQIKALVSGSDIYQVQIQIESLNTRDWQAMTRDCAQSIDSLMDLLQGRLSKGVMQRLTRQKDGLFPKPREIKIHCSCPDWAYLCKHAAAVLYGVGSRLDEEPELLFVLRGVDHLELITQAAASGNLDRALSGGGQILAEDDLGELFGIDLDNTSGPPADEAGTRPPTAQPARRKRTSPKRDPAKTKPKAAKQTAHAKAKSATKTTKEGKTPTAVTKKTATKKTPVAKTPATPSRAAKKKKATSPRPSKKTSQKRK